MNKVLRTYLIVYCMVCIFLLIAANGFAINDGLYSGEFEMCVDNPVQCAPINPGYARITNLEGNQILNQNVIIWAGMEIVIGEKICGTFGKAILCPPQDQILDMSVWGFDAIVTNKTTHGAGIITGENKFIMSYSTRLVSCEGSDCDIVPEWMFGEGAEIPCHIGPWISEYTRISE